MLNLIFIIFSFCILSYNNYLLFNEEFLIFICFIIFVCLVYIKFNQNIQNFFKDQNKEIQQTLKFSLNQYLEILKKNLILDKKFSYVLKNFNFLKIYYLNFILIINNLLIKFQRKKINLIFKKRLILINKVEQYTIKLLISIIIKNLLKIVKIKKFYSTILKINYFLSFDKILWRENIYFISQKK